jgi:hypothetical protein
MFYSPQSVDCQQHLPHLVRLGFAPVVLDVDAWIAGPGRPEDDMAAAPLPRFTEMLDTDLVKIREPHIAWLAPHTLENLLR